MTITRKTMSPAPVHVATPRRYDLDWLRVLAFALLIFYHVGMFYVTWEWHVKSPHASPFLEPVMALINPWRLLLLFFISGVALRFAIDKTSLRAFLPRRMLRLLLPIVFGMLVIVMPQAYFELRFKGEIGSEFWPFYMRYVAFDQDFSIIVPTWNHLWYLVYIMFYTLVVAALLPLLRWVATGPGARFLSWLENGTAGWRLLFIPALPFVLYRLTLDSRFPTTHALIDDWATHAHSLTIVLIGFMVARNTAFWRAVERALPSAFVVAVIAGVALLTARLNWEVVRQDEAMRMAAQVLRVFYAWVVIVALLGLAQRHLNRSGKTLTYLTQAIFPYYILHQTLIVATGYILLSSGLPVWAEAAVVTGGTVCGCLLLYEVIRRVPVLRPLFGLSFRQATGRRQAPLQAEPAGTV
jgi:glucans biosynthesis protein C